MTRRFLPWWRTGAAALVTRADGPALPARAELPVEATVNALHTATVTARLYGPGEVIGLDPRQVIRTDPVEHTTDFEPNLFPLIEFDAPELPWAFTPATADAADQLRPWLVLVVVPRAAARGPAHDGRPLPVLALDDARSQLPDLAQSWAWAHLQVTGTEATPTILTGPDPARTLSRLLCPRRLAGDTAYVAAVVPAFAQGVAAGLGQPVDAGELRPAWGPTTTAVELPVLFSWEFATGPVGDFEELAARLRPHPLAADDLAGLPVTVTDQPAGVPDAGTIHVPGALGTGDDLPPDVEPEVLESLASLLEIPGPVAIPADLPLPLPAYGRWHAGQRVAPTPTGTKWFDQLTLHPAARAVAALGTRAVQERQEQLMASAWAQVGEVARLNRLLRHGQLAREATRVLHRRVVPLNGSSRDAAEALVLAGPARHRLLGIDGVRTVAEHIATSRVPEALFTAAARRVLRVRGPLGRRAGVSATDLVLRADERDGRPGAALVGQPPRLPPGTITIEPLGSEDELPRLCGLGPGWWLERPGPRATLGPVAELSAWFAPCDGPGPPPALLPDEQVWAVRDGLDPERTVTTKVRSRVRVPSTWVPRDPLEPVLVAPEFPTPMYRWVRDHAPDLLLPGIGEIPVDSVSLVGTNPWFSAAFLAGLNHEMARELLWRGYPTDQRGTCFRRFWDRSVAVPPLTGADLDDIRPLPDWPLEEPLERAGLPPGPRPASELVLLLRGELPHRYPRATIYATKAVWTTTAAGERVHALPAAPVEEHAVFGGTLGADVTFRGFAISPNQARGDDVEPGYYIVLQEQPTEARFGLDGSAPTVPTGTWGDLSWETVTVSASGHVALGGTDPIVVPPGGNPRGLHFSTATTAAHIAGVVEQRPYRVAVHAAVLLPREDT
ncbi:hypothetical protein ACFPK1_27500 [Actinomycetospora rhizophila]|uniref:Uncharacterized protein n=1 Tax=Actinomycetospora rhizophila TaxID=1416876 RepID=A0ABV9ZL21_9PSEU